MPNAAPLNPINLKGEAAPAPSLQDVYADELIVGRPLEFPLYDDQGVLLLASGAVITSEVRRLLSSRGNGRVRMHASDVRQVTLQAFAGMGGGGVLAFDTELTRKLDQLCDTGVLEVVNKGPAVKDSVVIVGRKGYDAAQRQQLQEKHAQNDVALNQMMQEALRGRSLDGRAVAGMAADYLQLLTADSDCVLASTPDMLKEGDLAARSLEVSLLSMALAIEMGMDAENVRDIGLIGMVHDWGMLRLPPKIRQLDRLLTAVEFLEVQRHPIHSLEILQQMTSLPKTVALVSYQIHEQPNGQGYPRGRSANSIHPFAHVIHVADSYLALTAVRPHRPALMPYAAMECMLWQGKEGVVDRKAVKALLQVLSLFPLKSFVALSDGTVARVMRRSPKSYATPIVLRIQNSDGTAADPMDDDNLIDLAESPLKVQQALPTPGSGEVAMSPEFLKQTRGAGRGRA